MRAKEKGCIGDAALYMSSSEGGNPMPTTRIIARSPHATRIPICRTAPALAGACTWLCALVATLIVVLPAIVVLVLALWALASVPVWLFRK